MITAEEAAIRTQATLNSDEFKVRLAEELEIIEQDILRGIQAGNSHCTSVLVHGDPVDAVMLELDDLGYDAYIVDSTGDTIYIRIQW